jgi:hypothetical protein
MNGAASAKGSAPETRRRPLPRGVPPAAATSPVKRGMVCVNNKQNSRLEWVGRFTGLWFRHTTNKPPLLERVGVRARNAAAITRFAQRKRRESRCVVSLSFQHTRGRGGVETHSPARAVMSPSFAPE